MLPIQINNQIRNTNANITAHQIIQHSKVGISSCINCIPIKFTATRTFYTLHTLSIQLIPFKTIDVSTKCETDRHTESGSENEIVNEQINSCFMSPKRLKIVYPFLMLHRRNEFPHIYSFIPEFSACKSATASKAIQHIIDYLSKYNETQMFV